jgi:hypothetical protein
MISYFSYIENIMKRLQKNFHDFITLLKLVIKFTSFSWKHKKKKKNPIEHYSPESRSSQLGPCISFYSDAKPLSRFWRTEDAGEARFPAGWRSPAARERWWSKHWPVRTRWWPRISPRWPEEAWPREQRHRRHRARRRAADTTRLELAWQNTGPIMITESRRCYSKRQERGRCSVEGWPRRAVHDGHDGRRRRETAT